MRNFKWAAIYATLKAKYPNHHRGQLRKLTKQAVRLLEGLCGVDFHGSKQRVMLVDIPPGCLRIEVPFLVRPATDVNKVTVNGAEVEMALTASYVGYSRVGFDIPPGTQGSALVYYLGGMDMPDSIAFVAEEMITKVLEQDYPFRAEMADLSFESRMALQEFRKRMFWEKASE